MKAQTKHRVRIVLGAPLITFLVVSAVIMEDIEDVAIRYSVWSALVLNKLWTWVTGDYEEQWLRLWEKHLSSLSPDSITVEAVATAMNCSIKTAKRLCSDATHQGFFTLNSTGTYRLNK